MNCWREDAMELERDAPQSAEPTSLEPAAPQAPEESGAPLMLTDAMCGCACQLKAEPPLA
jgi:hypothetical protein